MLWRSSVKNYQLALWTVLIVAVLVGLRALLFAAGVEGMQPSVLASSIIAGGVFVMGLVIAGQFVVPRGPRTRTSPASTSSRSPSRSKRPRRHTGGRGRGGSTRRVARGRRRPG